MKYVSILFLTLFLFVSAVIFTVVGEGDVTELENIFGNSANDDYIAANINSYAVYLDSSKMNNYVAGETENITEVAAAQILPEQIADKEKILKIKVYDNEKDEVTEVPIEEYLYGVVFSEMPGSFEPEALKAQAVAARSFCFYKMQNSDSDNEKTHKGAHICNNPAHCKAYISYSDAVKKWGEKNISESWEKIKQAVDSTAGEILTYNDLPAITVFHAMSGKNTESASNLWGGDIPYLRSVPSPEEENNNGIKNFYFTVKISADEFKSKLKENNIEGDFTKSPSEWIGESVYNSSGRIDSIDILKNKVPGKTLRTIFALRSTDFRIEYKDKNFVITTEGYGHGVGMSQYGSNLLALEGKKYDEILYWYYTGVEIEYIFDYTGNLNK